MELFIKHKKMIEFKIRESTLKRYREVVKNYTNYDGMNVVDFQKATKVSSGLFEAMINEGLLKKDEDGIYRAINKDRERALKITVIDRVIRECCLKKARQNKHLREISNKRELSVPEISSVHDKDSDKEDCLNGDTMPFNAEIPFIEDLTSEDQNEIEVIRNPPFPGNSPKEIFQRLKNHYEENPVILNEEIAIDWLKENCDFEEICLEYLKNLSVTTGAMMFLIDGDSEQNQIFKYDIFINKPKFEIEKTKL